MMLSSRLLLVSQACTDFLNRLLVCSWLGHDWTSRDAQGYPVPEGMRVLSEDEPLDDAAVREDLRRNGR